MLGKLGCLRRILSIALGLSCCFAAHAAGPVSDDFHATSLNTTLWTFFNPVGDSSYAMTGSDLVLNVPAGANHDPTAGGSDNAVRMSQTVSNTDFTTEVKFDSIPSKQYQFQGVLVQQDASNFLRFQFGSTGSSVVVNASKIVAGVETAMGSSIISPPGPSVWMRIQKSGSTWTQTWSPDGTNYTTVNSFTQAETVATISLFGGNFNSTPSNAPSLAVYVDYFFNTASPISPEDGGGPNLSLVSVSPAATSAVLTWTTDVPASSRVDYGISPTYGSFVSDSTLVTAHSVTIPSLACGITYNFRVTSAVSTGSTVSPNGTFTTNSCSSVPDLTISKNHTGSFTQGQTGASYTLTVSNVGTAPTSGVVSASDTVPTGLTPTSVAGTGWACTQPAGPCTRSDALAAGAAYPPLTLTVNVASAAPASVTNSANVSGGGETNTSNDTASDPTTISAAGSLPVSDNFNEPALNTTLWTFVNPVGNGSVSMTGTDLQLTVPAGSNHDPTFGGVDNSVRVIQKVSNSDFNIEAKFDSIPSMQYQFQGFLVEQDSTNYIRVQFGSTGSSLLVTASKILAGSETGLFSAPVTPSAGQTSLWLRLQRSNSTWTVTWANDGITYNTLGSFSQALTVADLGLFAGNFNATAGNSPAFTAAVDYFAGAPTPDLTITKTHTGSFTLGQTGATYTITATNSGPAPTTGSVTVTDTLPAGLTATAVGGAGWTCTQPSGPCSRSDVLNGGSSYPPLTLTVNVAGNAPGSVTNVATVSGGGELNTSNDSASDATPISASAVPDLTVTKSHAGSFTQGQTGATYTITVTNSGTASTTAAVSLTDTVPAGLTATAIAGTGWTCTQPAGPCTRSDSLGAGASYPNLTLTVNLASNAPSSVTNTATVSGGGETNTSNDTATDPTSIQASVGAPVSDDFSSTTLNTAVWSFVNPQGDGSFSLNGSTLQLNVPAGINHDLWVNGENGVRVMQSIANADFEVEVKFNSVVDPTQPAQEQGIVVEQDGTHFLRFSEYSSTQQTILFVANCLGTTGNIVVNQAIRNGPNTYMRVKRVGDQWHFTYSYDSIHWTPAFTFTQALTVTKIGPYAANAQSGGPAPAFTAIVDHFVNRLSPPSTMNGSPYPTSAAPVINVWYGNPQTFGQNGVPQQWVNIVGDVSDYDEVSSLVYSLNGGAPQTLWMGENLVRLVSPGDYNVEIDYASLNSGTNTVAITATDTGGRQTTQTVTLNYVAGQSWPKTYSISWSGSGSVQSVSQVVDGMWTIQPAGFLENLETGYDRLVTIGDRVTWLNYTVTAQVTLNHLDGYGYAVGIIAGWQGHTTLQYGVALPDQPRTGHPFPGFGGYSMGYPGPPIINLYENTPTVPEHIVAQDTSGLTLTTGVEYIFKLQTQQNKSGGTHYSFKVWPASNPEPANWNVQADGELSNGSIVLVAHRADVSFGAINITGN